MRRFGPEHQQDLTVLLANAFLDDPVAAWCVPDQDERFQVMTRYFEIVVEHVLEHGVAYGPPDMIGAALWLDMLGSRAPRIDGLDQRLLAACGPFTGQFIELGAAFNGVHPKRPHWYLLFMGVVPAWRDKGIGSALLAFHHRSLDDHGHAAYLEASSTANRRLYQRNGYADLDGSPLVLPGGPNVWPLWRAPQTSPPAIRLTALAG